MPGAGFCRCFVWRVSYLRENFFPHVGTPELRGGCGATGRSPAHQCKVYEEGLLAVEACSWIGEVGKEGGRLTT